MHEAKKLLKTNFCNLIWYDIEDQDISQFSM